MAHSMTAGAARACHSAQCLVDGSAATHPRCSTALLLLPLLHSPPKPALPLPRV